MSELNNIIHKIKNSTVIEKLLLLNLVFFIIAIIGKSFVIQWLGLSSNLNTLILKPWSVLTYAIIHLDFFHLLSNLLILYYIGNLFLTFFNKTQLLAVYIYGLLSASLLFLLVAYFSTTSMLLIGASGAVTALFVAIATRIPQYELKLALIGFVKLWVLAAIWVGISLLQLTTNNFGGAIAHIGGALIGFFYVYLNLYRFDWNKFLNFSTKKKQQRGSHLKTIHKKSTYKKNSVKETDHTKQSKIDAILDKISKSGYDSLTQEERAFLFNQGK